MEGRLEQALGAGNSLDSRVQAAGEVHRFGQTFESGFRKMMAIASVKQSQMKVTLRMIAESAQKFLHQSEGKTSHRGHALRRFVVKKGPPAEVDDGPRQGFIHGHVSVAVAADASFFSEGLGERLAKGDSCIFNGVVKIYLDVAVGLNFKIYKAVPCKKREHMVEKRDLGSDRALTLSVHAECEANPRFSGVALDQGGSFAHRLGVGRVVIQPDSGSAEKRRYSCSARPVRGQGDGVPFRASARVETARNKVAHRPECEKHKRADWPDALGRAKPARRSLEGQQQPNMSPNERRQRRGPL